MFLDCFRKMVSCESHFFYHIQAELKLSINFQNIAMDWGGAWGGFGGNLHSTILVG